MPPLGGDDGRRAGHGVQRLRLPHHAAARLFWRHDRQTTMADRLTFDTTGATHPMSRRRATVLGITAILASVWAYACGDGAVEPQPPPSDPPHPTMVTVTPTTAVLTALQATAQFAAEVRDQNGQAMAGTAVTWASNDLLVAGVNASGLVIAVGNGRATITATAGSASGTAAVTVAQTVDAVGVSPAVDTLLATGTLRLQADASDANGHPVEGAKFAWASGDTLVAVVDGEGLVTGVAAGEAEITATSAGATGRARLTIVALGPPTVIVLSPAADTITPGETVQLAVEAFDANGFAVGGAEFAWSSSDVSVAQVDASGLVTAMAAGRAMITAVVGEAWGTSEISVVTAADRDRAALVALYKATDGPNWVNSENWLTDAPLSEWHGVYTSGSGRVQSLSLQDNGLTGPIPPELGNLTSLGNLSLSSNNLNGPIPSELGNLASLRSLYLDANDLTGPIPSELGDLARLEYLFLHRNRLTGPIPSELGDLARLKSLLLFENALTGPIPPELGDLARLKSLLLFENALTGPIPAELGDLANLTDLDFSSNNLEGSIPPELGNLASLNHRLGLAGNALTGPIPPELGNLVFLGVLSLHGNALTGSIPPELGNLASLRSLSVSNNNGLAGRLPDSLRQLSLRQFLWDHTNLCAPPTPAFRAWLNSIESHQPGRFCASGGQD